jgi:hypothetical protein
MGGEEGGGNVPSSCADDVGSRRVEAGCAFGIEEAA